MGQWDKSEALRRVTQFVYSDEGLSPFISLSTQPRFREDPPQEPLPPLLAKARAMEKVRRTPSLKVFKKQARLLADYEDDYPIPESFLSYFPTYARLTDPVLRGYFSWRTKLRQGQPVKGPLTFVYLRAYEIINQVGFSDPMEGFHALRELRDIYSQMLDLQLTNLDRWLVDYVAYYGLDPALVADNPLVALDRPLMVLSHVREETDARVAEAVMALAPQWLNRSRFYKTHREDYERVLRRVLCRMADHFSRKTQKTLVSHFFGLPSNTYQRPFSNAVFLDEKNIRDYDFAINEYRVYQCRYGEWSVYHYLLLGDYGAKLTALLRAIDALMRQAMEDKHPIRHDLTTKWLLKAISEEIDALLAEKKAAEAKKLSINYKQLSKIRKEAARTQKKLTVEEEEEAFLPPEPPQSAPPPEIQPPEPSPALTGQQRRLLRCLLYGGSLAWIQEEGCILSVLADGINEALFDIFQDTVVDDTPALVEDYIDQLKEMIAP